jgi:4-amino-4-deoxy-L-arabinose transferase-like glycosyltransferase
VAQSIPLTIPEGERAARLRARWHAWATARWSPWLALSSVVALSVAMNAWQLGGNGYGNTYYAAAARSMSLSWNNFFFGAFDPGGFITVDKPPVFLWFGALSVRIFGYSSWSLLLPSAIAGATSVALVWLIVRRYFGVAAATIAGVVLALTPITVAVDRLNLPEPFYILALIAAAGAILQSFESKRWWAWILAAGFFVGVAFNTKMLAGWIPGPALALALIAGQAGPWRNATRGLALRLALLAAATLAVSASWMLVIDAWPASDRPYVGGSADNSVANLALDYNGLGRVDGQSGQPGGGGQRPGGAARPNTFGGGAGGNANGGAGAFNATGPGGIIAGTPGLWRMFDSANGGQIAWFLPFAVLGSVLCFWRWRRDRVKRAATLLFLGWVLLFGGVFSYAQGTYHSYYTAALAPGIAALVGMTVVAAYELIRANRIWLAAVAAIAAVTVGVQLTMAGRFNDFHGDLRPVLIVFTAAGGALLVAWALRQPRLSPAAGLSLMLAGLLVIPGSWSVYESTHPSLNTTLPQAGPRGGISGQSFGSEAFDGGTATLAAWLNAHRDPNARWDLVVSSAQNASTLIAEDHLSVMALGGFLGSDPTITVNQFATYVDQGAARYVLASGGRGGPIPGFGGGAIPNRGRQQPQGGRFGGTPNVAPRGGFGAVPNGGTSNRLAPAAAAATTAKGATVVMSAVQSVCTPVTGNGVPAQYSGQIYDCAGKGAALRAAS